MKVWRSYVIARQSTSAPDETATRSLGQVGATTAAVLTASVWHHTVWLQMDSPAEQSAFLTPTDVWPGVAALTPVEPPPWLRVEATLMATARAVRAAFDHRLGVLDLNLTQATMLAYVAEYGPITQTQISDHNGIGRAATGSAIDRLESRGLVERRPNPDDRRVWLVALTAAGDRLVQQIREVDHRLQSELRAGISRQDRLALANVMNRLQENVALALAAPVSHPLAEAEPNKSLPTT